MLNTALAAQAFRNIQPPSGGWASPYIATTDVQASVQLSPSGERPGIPVPIPAGNLQSTFVPALTSRCLPTIAVKSNATMWRNLRWPTVVTGTSQALPDRPDDCVERRLGCARRPTCSGPAHFAAGSPARDLLRARLAARRGAHRDAETYYQRAIYGRWEDDATAQRLSTRFELLTWLEGIDAAVRARAELVRLLLARVLTHLEACTALEVPVDSTEFWDAAARAPVLLHAEIALEANATLVEERITVAETLWNGGAKSCGSSDESLQWAFDRMRKH
jgi:hypothetical protein